MFGLLKKIFGSAQDRKLKQYWKIVHQVNEWDKKFESLSNDELKLKTVEFRERLAKGEPLDHLLPEAYAVVKGVCRRLCGTEVHVSGYNQRWDMIPYDVQILGGIAMHHGSVAEMMTGEGKTLTAVMPLYLNALTGKPVHLVTVNDYLVQRDCQWVGEILRWLGITTAALVGETPLHTRREVYKADVVYGTASEFGFDYLRDNSTASRAEEQTQRGYYFAIVDEIDSILIDEARTPLIISGPVPVSRQMYDQLIGGVSELVKKQRDLCNRLATEARKVIEPYLVEGGEAIVTKDKKKLAELKEAYRKMWLVSKGTPRNKILKRTLENPDARAAINEWDLYYYSDPNKSEKAEALAELYITVEEKNNEFELTDKGILGWQNSTGNSSEDFVMLDLAHEYLMIDENSELSQEIKMERKLAIREEDAKRKERAHNLRQLLRAQLLMENDVDYMVQDGKVIIIDENTGRAQPGRRFSDGLHQAIEAKEGVPIQKETQTYATITLQNYFRMYAKLAGMTGTASTEAGEFKEIYKLNVLEIPSNKPSKRQDANDEIYMTEREKYAAILKDVNKVHAEGRPILIGTESVDISEKLSRIFRQNNLPHTILNAKNNAKEAEIIANAGQHGAITISTNMAGRGTDIKLGPGIADIGGLYVIGTTRHQSRRIDRQLRGRSARQGDPGSSKFYVSFEDQLMRLFASPRLNSVLKKFRPPEGEAISAGILNRSIETAQKRIEQRNYMQRKHTIEYDDVMNKQRQEIYSFRNDILHSKNIIGMAEELLTDVCIINAEEYLIDKGTEGGWNPIEYQTWLSNHFPVSFESGIFDDDHLQREDIEKMAAKKVIEAFSQKMQQETKKVPPVSTQGLNSTPSNVIEDTVRDVMLRKVDQQWQEHLLVMDHLRADVHLRGVGGKDPLLEFKHEAFKTFDALSRHLQSTIALDLFRFEIITHEQLSVNNLLARLKMETNRSFVSEMEKSAPSLIAPSGSLIEQEEIEMPEKPQPILANARIGRNDPCPCGSGKKYKKCCGVLAGEEVKNGVD